MLSNSAVAKMIYAHAMLYMNMRHMCIMWVYLINNVCTFFTSIHEHLSMVCCKTCVTPVLTHGSYHSLAISHQYWMATVYHVTTSIIYSHTCRQKNFSATLRLYVRPCVPTLKSHSWFSIPPCTLSFRCRHINMYNIWNTEHLDNKLYCKNTWDRILITA